LSQAQLAQKHPFLGVFVLHSIHCRKTYITDVTMLNTLFHWAVLLNPFIKPLRFQI